MKILIEQCDYAPNILEKLLPTDYLYYKKKGEVQVNYVGYYNHFDTNETIIILPKIFADKEQKVFGKLLVQDLAAENALELLKNQSSSKSEIDFIHRFAFIFYLSLREFQARNAETTISEDANTKNLLSNLEQTEVSELDLVFSLLRFYQENRELIIFKQKENEKQHFQKTNWAKTIRKQTPIFQGNTPIYLETHQKQKTQNHEDELLKIYMGLLQRFKAEYGFHISIEHVVNQRLDSDFDRKSLRTLKQIRHQYFQDKFKKLLLQLIAYFEKRDMGSTKQGAAEYILCRNYNIVFEDMIDKLLTDKGKHINSMKIQPDGKIADHIFEMNSLFNPDSIFYIGDSKYYKDTTPFSKNSIYKQHTYAKNVIQYNINLFHDGKQKSHIRYRDELTEGYNISPNFFIQGYINHQNLTDSADHFEFDTETNIQENRHFENRVFDRDTLFVLHFRINFIFVLYAYIEQSSENVAQFKAKATQEIHRFVKKYFEENYDFYVLQPQIEIESFVNAHFKTLNGKIYRTSDMENCLILGLKKGREDSNILKEKYEAMLTPYIFN